MKTFDLNDQISPAVLASDLDGTLIPLEEFPENREALAEIAEAFSSSEEKVLLFATGRHFESVLEAIEQYGLPEPAWIVCDVGTSIYHKEEGRFKPFAPYRRHLDAHTGRADRSDVEDAMGEIAGLELQPPAHQRRFKISYYCKAEDVDALVESVGRACSARNLPYVPMGSVDPFNGKGLIDLLPADVNKAYGLLWLATHADFDPNAVVYAGDSGNDLAALISGFRAIAVGNMDPKLAGEIRDIMEARGLSHRFLHAKKEGTSGVLEGCRHFGLI